MAARLSLALKVLFAKADTSLHVVAGNTMISVPERIKHEPKASNFTVVFMFLEPTTR